MPQKFPRLFYLLAVAIGLGTGSLIGAVLLRAAGLNLDQLVYLVRHRISRDANAWGTAQCMVALRRDLEGGEAIAAAVYGFPMFHLSRKWHRLLAQTLAESEAFDFARDAGRRQSAR